MNNVMVSKDFSHISMLDGLNDLLILMLGGAGITDITGRTDKLATAGAGLFPLFVCNAPARSVLMMVPALAA